MVLRTHVFVTLVALLFLTAGAAVAHQRTAAGPQSGVPIPGISHGEMVVMAENRDRIIDLAAGATNTNEPFRRILNYARIQYAYCLWGRMPGSVTDEASPFNECSHAYLAATKAVLLAMREMPQEAEDAGEIISVIDAAMVLRGLALIGCQFSGETFNTADVVRPHWEAVSSHPASLATLTGLVALVGAGCFGVRCLGRNYPRTMGRG